MAMEGELTALEAKLEALLKAHSHLRRENHDLRQQLLTRNDEVARLSARIAEARERVERLLKVIPESTDNS
jgi:uncharacterized protein (TIGR02449 family)